MSDRKEQGMFNDEELRIISIVVGKADPMNLIQVTQEIQRKIEAHFAEIRKEPVVETANAEPVE